MYKFHVSVILLSILLVVTSCFKDGKPIDNLKVGDTVPSFSAESVATGGNSLDSSSFTSKRSLLVLFVTTCSDCRRELPLIEWVWDEVKYNPAIQVVAISRGEECRTKLLGIGG